MEMDAGHCRRPVAGYLQAPVFNFIRGCPVNFIPDMVNIIPVIPVHTLWGIKAGIQEVVEAVGFLGASL
ncbi:MAG: hypothetical protein COB30_013100 [Ectothiorhodospiraceae bacterium]|nr:hypothetical protein [Ectothiorhodospiraceae bacterium]